MSERSMSLVFASGISDLTQRNASFDSGVLRVAYTGRNRNNSFISKETFERCIQSIYNCPIVCNYDRETDTIGEHDMTIVPDESGGMRVVNETQPVGLVPESARWWWQEMEDEGGIHEYLCVDVLLWKRQEAYRKIKEDGITDESMEISVKEGGMQDGVYVIDRFEFTAFCLLGSAKPCYEGASLETFSNCTFKQQLAEMMREFKEAISKEQPSPEVAIDNQKFSMGGGEEALEEKMALVAEYGVDIDTLDFAINDFTVEELREKFETLKAEPSAEPEEPVQGDQSFSLEGQLRDELVEALEAETVETCFGPMPRYWFMDYDREAMEVYGHDEQNWNLYGFPFTMDGDHVVIDFDAGKRKKIAVVDYDEGAQGNALARVFAQAQEKYTANDTQWAEKYQAAEDKAASMEGELNTLRQFKAETEEAQTQVERNEIFAKFEDLNGVEAFETLREHSAEYALDTLEEKCYALRGRYGMQAKFSCEPKAPKLPVDGGKRTAKDEPYGGIFAEYGIYPDNQPN